VADKIPLTPISLSVVSPEGLIVFIKGSVFYANKRNVREPILVKQPIELPAAHVRIRTDSGGVFVVAATTNLISQIKALKKNIHIPVKTK
jgi:hypothetical protein